jgi:hypothetical protein
MCFSGKCPYENRYTGECTLTGGILPEDADCYVDFEDDSLDEIEDDRDEDEEDIEEAKILFPYMNAIRQNNRDKGLI